MTNKERKYTYTIHRAKDRGKGEYGWLSTFHSFSFANWHDQSRMNFGVLRVLNDDTVKPGFGFDTHEHRNMEIISIVTLGILTHKDSTGRAQSLTSGEVQVMSAGTGIFHSEYNSSDEELKFFQIWIMPNKKDVAPRYEQKKFPETKHGETLLVGPIGHVDTLNINQDAYISRISINKDEQFLYSIKNKGNGVYFFVVKGNVSILKNLLNSKDAIGIENAKSVLLTSDKKSEILAIEVPMSRI